MARATLAAGFDPALSWVWALHVDHHRPAPSQKQDYLLSLTARRIDIPMHRTWWDVEEISWINPDGIPSTGTTLEANRSRNDMSIDVVVPMVMPTGDHARVSTRVNHQEPFPLESQVPGNARASWGFWEGVFLQAPDLGHGRASFPTRSPPGRSPLW